MSRRAITSLICLLAVNCGGPTHPDVPDDAVEIAFRRLPGLSGLPKNEPVRLVIPDVSNWQQLSDGSAPPLDFDTEILVMVAMGVRPTSGFDISVRKVYGRQQELFIHVFEGTPSPDCGVLEQLTAPWDAVAVRRDGWVAWTFLESSEVRGCG